MHGEAIPGAYLIVIEPENQTGYDHIWPYEGYDEAVDGMRRWFSTWVDEHGKSEDLVAGIIPPDFDVSTASVETIQDLVGESTEYEWNVYIKIPEAGVKP
jgi:hypothetical protein